MTFSSFSVADLSTMPSNSEVVLRYIREAIVSGVIAEEEPIRQDEIAKRFNVSKIPVREALKRLEAEGLVEFIKNKGAIVTKISDTDLAQIFEVRVMLETKLIALAIPNMTLDTIEKAKEICRAFGQTQDLGQWARLNWQLHSCLYEPAQRPYMLGLIRSIYDKIERYLRIQMSNDQGKRHADLEHWKIVDACSEKDIKLAEYLIEKHINHVCHDLYVLLGSTQNSSTSH
ncbi:GntR family transcriptional regulator [Acinetobacter sp. B5B]|uniref:GntR family transcriptional regulator n=1 Tax=Acinetobacter baretiae TaxID=2605383 RepID=UPI0018C2FCEF|nr:GntR family transcriptional regulator [Acinetobacter baretiae]MBF7682628.1 GntR family transcriptional regulator [Acinetobacter baretiae]MBF7685606.1 GntR family transcriptional regulator [Acinetobacter baretiae]